MKQLRICMVVLVQLYMAVASAEPDVAGHNLSAAASARDWSAVPEHRAQYGVMLHYLPAVPQRFSAEAVAALADDVAATGASYLIFTLGQNGGVYHSPNAQLKKLCPDETRGGAAPHLGGFDLAHALAQQLRARSIAFVLYLPFRAPQHNRYLLDCLGDVSEQRPMPPQFVERWSAVIEAWSLQFGALATGWWFDGVYNTTGLSAAQWQRLCTAALAGNANRLLAFNAGEGVERLSKKNAPCQNWAAGEMLAFRGGVREADAGLVFHILTPLTLHWGHAGQIQYSAQALREMWQMVQQRRGYLTVDIPVEHQLRIARPYIDAMSALRH